MIPALAYACASELLDDELRAARARLQLVRDLERRGEPAAWSPDVLAAEARIDGRLRITPAELVPIARLRASFGLGDTELRVVWTLVAHELCPQCRALLRDLDGGTSLDPTADALRRAVYAAVYAGRCDARVTWSELGADGALRRFGLIERTDTGSATPHYRQTWKIAERVLALAHGELALDRALAHLATSRPVGRALDGLAVAPGVAERLARACAHDAIVVAYGRAGTGRRSVLEALQAQRGAFTLQIEGRAIARDRDAAARELRGLARECALLGVVPLVRDLEALAASGDVPDRLDLVETELSGLVLATAGRVIARRWRRPTSQVELAPLTGDQRAAVWRAALPALAADRADELATLYPVAPAFVHAAAASIHGDDPTQIAAGLRAVLDDRLAGLATRIEVTQTWDDMVLPDEQLGAIIELMSRIRERRVVFERWGFGDKVGKGLGTAALFSGPPGTGKTMTAGLIARDLGVELYQVDLSKIVSKWIGETEKNLAALFDAAEAGHAVLLFDEADALFGKRTEVRSSNDRHSNQEVNFLLQRLESFAGILILTTNHETAIDEAFRRRLSIHVRFPMPELDERLKLWRAMIPRAAPTTGELGFERLAESFVMSGGHIRNAVLRAAFLAAAEDRPIARGHVLRAAQLEYEAMGKLATA